MSEYVPALSMIAKLECSSINNLLEKNAST